MRHGPTKVTLALQILLGAVLVALSVGILGFLEFDRERKHLEQNLLMTATAVDKAVDIELQTVLTGTSMLLASNRDFLDRQDLAGLHANLTKAAGKTRLINHFVLLDTSGQQLLNTQVSFDTPLPVTKNLDKYSAAIETGRPTISPLIIGTISKRPEILIIIPVIENGKTRFLFTSVISVRGLTGLLTSLNVPPEWLANIFDNQQNIVARTRDEDRFIGKKVSTGLQEQLKHGSSAIFESDNLNNVRSIAAFHQSETTGFGVTIGVPKSLIIQQAIEAQIFPGLLTVLAVFFLLMAWHYGMELMRRRDAEERFSASLANAAVGFAMTRLDGKFIDVNRAYCELTGYSLEEIRQFSFRQFIHPDDQQENMALYHRMLAGEIPAFVIENRFIRKDGRTVWVRKSISIVRGSNREPQWSFALVEDITDRKKTEVELEEKNQALERSNADLEQFAYVASHDLQTPLRNIVHYTQLLERRYKGKFDSETDDFIGFVVDGGKRMTRLLSDILTFSRVSRQSEPLRPIPAGDAVTQALLNLGPELVKSDAELQIDTLPVVMADQTYLTILFQNLLGNALKFRAPERKLVLSIKAQRDSSNRWRFAVSDNGIGISAEFHDKIFDIFQQLNPTAGSREGTGIGLTLCRRIVYHFGGNIWVDSTPGEGATFFFTLTQADETATPPSA